MDYCRYLDKEGFAAIGMITDATLPNIDRIYSSYGEGGSGDGKDGKGPGQGKAANQGNAYLDAVFPRLAQIVEVTAWQQT